jgi:hypothetical protein
MLATKQGWDFVMFATMQKQKTDSFPPDALAKPTFLTTGLPSSSAKKEEAEIGTCTVTTLGIHTLTYFTR